MKWREWAAALRRDRKAMAGLVIVGGFAVMAVVGPALVDDPTAIVDVPRQAPSWDHWFGTNGQGQDVFAQTVVGARVTLAVAFAVGLIVTLLGAAVGVSGAYFGGRTDGALSIGTNVFLVIPGLPLAIVLAAYLPPGPVSIAAVLALSGWAWNARVFRAQALTLRRRDYVSAAIVAGEKPAAIIGREIIPNMVSLMVSAFIGATIYAIAAQVGLEFLGLGDVGAVTWGTNLYWAANDAALITNTWWEFLPTGLCVAMVGFGLALINFGIDEVTNPRLRSKSSAVSASPLEGEGRGVGDADAEPDVDHDAVLEIRDLTITYAGSDAPAVDHVSLRVMPGELVALAGESGSGKTTVGYSILRLLPDDARVSGSIVVDGRDVLAMGPDRLRTLRWRQASMVFQSALNALNPVLTVREQLVDTLRAHQRIATAEASARAAELMTLVELDPADLDAYPHQLSGGMRQRVVIAMALALRPRLVIMDEPTTALDVVVQKQILERVIALQGELGFAVLFISHDLRLLMGIADRVGVMRYGELVEIAPAAQLRASPAHPYTRQLVSSYASPGRLPLLAPSDTEPLLSVRDLGKSYVGRRGRTQVLRGVSFDVAPGEVVALVGQSGSGKSTIARLVARLERPDAGTIEVGGVDALTAPLREYRAEVQTIFQDPFASLNPVHRVSYHVERPLLCTGASPAEARSRAVDVLAQVGLRPAQELSTRFPHELSGGQRQRVAVARALAVDPRLVIADEPTSMLDASIRAELLALLRRLARDRGLGVLLITHDLGSASRWADRVLVLNEGRIVESGDATRVFNAPTHDYTALLVEAASFGGHGAIEEQGQRV